MTLPVCLSTAGNGNIDFVLNTVAAFFIIEIDDLMEPKLFSEQKPMTFEHHNTTKEGPKNVKELFESFEKLKRAYEKNLNHIESSPSRKDALIPI